MMHDEVVSRLRHVLTEGEIPPGARIPERELCASFAISRMVVWSNPCRRNRSSAALRMRVRVSSAFPAPRTDLVEELIFLANQF